MTVRRGRIEYIPIFPSRKVSLASRAAAHLSSSLLSLSSSSSLCACASRHYCVSMHISINERAPTSNIQYTVITALACQIFHSGSHRRTGEDTIQYTPQSVSAVLLEPSPRQWPLVSPLPLGLSVKSCWREVMR